jgi:hypothetical protein
MSTLNSATNIVDSLILNPKSDFGFKDMEPGKIYYIVGKSLKISSEHFSEPYKKFMKFLEAGNYCLSFFSSFDSVTDVTGESRLHPMLFKLYIDSNNEWMLDVRIFTSQKIVDNCNKYKWTTFISDFYLNGKEAKAFVNQEEVGQYIRNIGFRIRLNKDLTVLENIYQITGSTINFLDMTNFNNIFSIKHFIVLLLIIHPFIFSFLNTVVQYIISVGTSFILLKLISVDINLSNNLVIFDILSDNFINPSNINGFHSSRAGLTISRILPRWLHLGVESTKNGIL